MNSEDLAIQVFCFRHKIYIFFKGNYNFLSHNSDFFESIEILHLTIQNWYLAILIQILSCIIRTQNCEKKIINCEIKITQLSFSFHDESVHRTVIWNRIEMHTYSALFFSTSSTFFILFIAFSFSSVLFLFSALNCLYLESFSFCCSPSCSTLPDVSEAGLTVRVGFFNRLSALRESLETDGVFWGSFSLTFASFARLSSFFFSGFAGKVYTHTHTHTHNIKTADMYFSLSLTNTGIQYEFTIVNNSYLQ